MKKFVIILMVSVLIHSCCESSDYNAMPVVSPQQGQGGSLATFVLVGDYLYVVDEFDLNVFDISVPDSPTQKADVNIGIDIETLFYHKGNLYVGSRNGMFIYSLKNPERPEQLSSVEHFTACDPVVANDSISFVTLHSNTRCGNNVNRLEVYNTRNLTNPSLLTTVEMVSPKGLGLYHQYLFVCDDQIKVFDVSVPDNPTVVDSIGKESFDVIIKDDLLIAIGEGGLHQYGLTVDGNSIHFNHYSSIDF